MRAILCIQRRRVHTTLIYESNHKLPAFFVSPSYDRDNVWNFKTHENKWVFCKRNAYILLLSTFFSQWMTIICPSSSLSLALFHSLLYFLCLCLFLPHPFFLKLSNHGSTCVCLQETLYLSISFSLSLSLYIYIYIYNTFGCHYLTSWVVAGQLRYNLESACKFPC